MNENENWMRSRFPNLMRIIFFRFCENWIIWDHMKFLSHFWWLWDPIYLWGSLVKCLIMILLADVNASLLMKMLINRFEVFARDLVLRNPQIHPLDLLIWRWYDEKKYLLNPKQNDETKINWWQKSDFLDKLNYFSYFSYLFPLFCFHVSISHFSLLHFNKNLHFHL